jgi:IMP dehydrogenase/GMP reductase
MDKKNPTNFLYVLNAIIPLIELGGTGIFASNSLWSIVLGVMPIKEGERENQIMEINRKDATKYKIEGIKRLTQLAESITQRNDFNDENLQDFTYAIRQLTRYVWGDEEATTALKELKNLYISTMTEYFYQSVKSGKKKEATKNLVIFGEEILKEDKDLRGKLAKIITYKPLN